MNNENAVAELRMQISAQRELEMTECSPPLSYLKGNAQSRGPVLTTSAPELGNTGSSFRCPELHN